MAAPLRATGGAPLLGGGGRPLLASPPDVRPTAFEPEAPTGWTQVLYDNFAGTTLDRSKWQILYGGNVTPNGVQVWDHAGIIVNNGLTVRAWKDAQGQWRGGGIQQGNLSTGFTGYSDFQVTVKARFPAAQGVGAYVAAWPVSENWPPEFDLVETPGKAKNQLMVTWHWPGNNLGDSAYYSLDLTVDHLYTARRQGDAWHLWVDGVELPVPTSWVANPDPSKLAIGIAAFVAAASESWYGGGPDATTPNPYDAVVSYVRIHAPTTGGGGTTTPPDVTPTEEAQAARDFLAPLKTGVNIERDRAWTMSYGGEPLNESDAYWEYLAGIGVTHVRFFYPWRPSVDMNGEGDVGTTIPSVARIGRMLDAAEHAISAGLKVFLDCCDILGLEDLTSGFWPAVQQFVVRFGEQVALRPALDPEMFCIGPVNEWAGGTNADYNVHRLALHDALRALLPDHVLVTGAAQWNTWWYLGDSQWAAPSDRRCICQWHAYEGGQTLAGWQNVQSSLAAFSARFDGMPTYCGEAGFNEQFTGSHVTFDATWAPNMRLQVAALLPQRPTWWAVTTGEWWRMNNSASDPTIRPEIAAEIAAAAGTVYVPPGGGQGGAAPTAALVIDPQQPLPQAPDASGQATTTMRIGSNTHAYLFWQVVEGPSSPTPWAFRGPWIRADLVGGWASIAVTWTRNEQFIKVADPALSNMLDGGFVSLTTAPVEEPTSPSIALSSTHITPPYGAYGEIGTLTVTGTSEAVSSWYVSPSTFGIQNGNQLAYKSDINPGTETTLTANVGAIMASGGVVQRAITITVGTAAPGGGTGGGTTDPPPAAPSAVILGVKCPSNFPAEVAQFEQYLGRQVDAVLAYTGGGSWEALDPGWQTSSTYLAGTGRQLLWSCEMYPRGAGVSALREVASGSRNSMYTGWAQTILASRSGDTGPIYVRTTWELGGEWFPWTADAQADPAAYRAAFGHMADSFHAVSSRFKMVWDTVGDRGEITQWYPGDDKVDVISQDLYWQRQWTSPDPVEAFGQGVNEERGLNWIADFAAQRGKPIAIPEWGVQGDDAGPWIDCMRDWIASHNVVFATYWNDLQESGYDGYMTSNRWPNAAAALRNYWNYFKTGSSGGGTTTPPPAGSPVARLDILGRGQSNYFQAHWGGAVQRLRDIVAHLTQIPDVRLISRNSDALDDNTIFSGTWSILSQGRGVGKHWLSCNGAAPVAGWVAQDPLQQTLRAVDRYVSADPDHALVDLPMHWEFDIGVWEEPDASLYHDGAWEIVRRIRERKAKNAGRAIVFRLHCSYGGGSTNRMFDVNASWLADAANAGLHAHIGHGNMLDGEPYTQWDPNGDSSHNNYASLVRSFTRAGVALARVCWERGWCPSNVDLSWLPGPGPRIVSGTRSGNSVTLTIQHDKGTAIVAANAGTNWGRFTVDGVGNATGGAILDATHVRVDFGSAIPAGAVLRYCWEPWITGASGGVAESGRTILRDNWHAIRPAQAAAIPGIADYENLVQRTWAPLTIP